MNSEKNGIRDPSVNRSIVSMKNCGISLKKHVRSFLGFTPIEVEPQGVFRNFFSVKETRIHKALHYNFVKAAVLDRRILPGNVLDAFDAVFVDIIDVEHHGIIDHLGDVTKDSALDVGLSFGESTLVDPIGVGFCHDDRIVSSLYNKCCKNSYKRYNYRCVILQI